MNPVLKIRNLFSPDWRIGDPAWPAAAMLVLTGAYLMVEAPFAAYLVDLVGSQTTQAEIDNAELAGRVISGAALAIFVVGFILKNAGRNMASPGRAFMKTLIPVAAIMACMFVGERSIVDTIADNSSARLRARSLDAEMARKALFPGGGGLAGISPTDDEMRSPSWKAFVGLFPFLAQDDMAVLDRAEAGRSEMVREGTNDTFPNPSAYRKDVYGKAMESMRDAYVAYRSASAKLYEVINDESITKKAWDDYDKFVIFAGTQKFLYLAKVPQDRIDLWRAGLKREYGMDLPTNWSPWDKVTFVAVEVGKYRQAAQALYDAAIAEKLGSATPVFLPPSYATFEGFLAQPPVQDALRRALGLRPGRETLTAMMEESSFMRAVYEPSRKIHEGRLGDLENRPDVLDRSSPLDTLGRDAVRSMVVPVMALSLSLLGMLVHLVKFTNYAVETLARGLERRSSIAREVASAGAARWMTTAVTLCALVVAVHTPAEAITDSPLYGRITKPLERDFGHTPVRMATFVIEIEAQAHPFGRALEYVGPFRIVRSMLTPPAQPTRLAEQLVKRPGV